jgi:MFS transporter, PAT family, beta-lactamase induction signal transducer AmpG
LKFLLATVVKVFQNRKMAALLLLGFSSGLPLYLTSDTLQAWLTIEQVDLKTIGFATLLSFPYTLKFLWAPLIDRFSLPFLDRRRSWIAITQFLLGLGLLGMSFQSPRLSLPLLAGFAVVVAFLSATQDIVFDAYRTDVLEEQEVGNGAAIGVFGYRIALLVTNGLALILADHLGWPLVYRLLALLMMAGIPLTFWAPKIKKYQPPESLIEAVILPLREFFMRSGWGRGIAIISFVILYKFGDYLASRMATAFLLKTGFSQSEIGVYKGVLGFAALTLGVLISSIFLKRLGINRCLWIFGGLQAVSNLAYFALAVVGKSYPLVVTSICIENFCAGLGTAAFVAFLISQCDPRYSATQYALLSSLMTFGSTVVASPAGAIAERSGWPLFFAITTIAAIPGLLLLPVFAPWNAKTTQSSMGI